MTELNPTLLKRFSREPMAALITFALGVATSLIWTFYSGPSPIVASAIPPAPVIEGVCLQEAFLSEELELTFGLRVLEAKCDEFSFSAKVVLTNYGPKSIRGYQVGTVQDYQYKRDVQSSTGVTSSTVVVAPGKGEIVNLSGGFRDGKSYNRPTGRLLRVRFWLKRVDFTDGTSWPE